MNPELDEGRTGSLGLEDLLTGLTDLSLDKSLDAFVPPHVR